MANSTPLPQTEGSHNFWRTTLLPLLPEVRPGLAGISITWGFNPLMYGGAFSSAEISFMSFGRELYETFDMQAYLSQYFDVRLEGLYVTDEMVVQYSSWGNPFTDRFWGLRETAVSAERADIYLANPVQAQLMGNSRTIPEEMIRRYAPNYAALLDRENGWGISRAQNGEQMALNTFDAHHYDLDIFSVYRLDWLEAINFPLPGSGYVTQIGSGVYFTPESYTFNEFMQILESVSGVIPHPNENPSFSARNRWGDITISAARERAWGMEVNLVFPSLRPLLPILGMFGVNTSIMEENGEAIPFFASRAYREALLFLEDLIARDMVFTMGGNNNEGFISDFIRVGWASVYTQDLFNVINQAHLADPSARFLITPPEIGNGGNRGAGLMQSSSAFNANGTAWVIDTRTSDDTLSRILNIFDALSFDPELFLITTYGFHSQSPYLRTAVSPAGRSFGGDTPRVVWNGEPFDSIFKLQRPIQMEIREGVFATGIIDGITFPKSLHGEFPEVSAFAGSDAGMRLNLPPAREDTHNDFAIERAYLDSQHWQTLMSPWDWDFQTRTGSVGIVFAYLIELFNGESNIALTWDEYIASLEANGLQEYIDLFSRFPEG